MMNSLPIKKRYPGALLITSEIGGMTFTRSLLDSRVSINIFPKAVFNYHHADGSVRKPHVIVKDVIFRIEDCYFSIDFLVIHMKMTKELRIDELDYTCFPSLFCIDFMQ